MNKMLELYPRNIIVIGGNAAGPAAAAKAKRVAPNANVTLIESSEFISTGTCEIPYVLSGEIQDIQKIIFYDSQKFKEEKGVDVLLKNFVETIDRKNKTIRVKNLNDGNNYQLNYDKLILSTGSKAKVLHELEGNFNNVFSLKSVTDLIRLQKFIQVENPKTAVLIGAGYIGLEVSEALMNLGIAVTLIEKKSLPFPSAETEIQSLIRNELDRVGVNFIGGFSKINFFDENKLTKVVVDGRIIESDFVIQCLGFTPNIHLAVSSGLSIGNYSGVVTDYKLKTSDPNIYAAGDLIEVMNKITKKKEFLPIATIAHQFGHIAGANAAGANEFYNPVVKNVAVKIFNNTYTNVGLTKTEAENNGFSVVSSSAISNHIIKVMPSSRKVFGKINVDKNTGKILGASFWGGDEVVGFADLISLMIMNDISAEKLSSVYYNYTPPKSPFVNLLSLLGRKVKEAK